MQDQVDDPEITPAEEEIADDEDAWVKRMPHQSLRLMGHFYGVNKG
jgi:hypothetical protein